MKIFVNEQPLELAPAHGMFSFVSVAFEDLQRFAELEKYTVTIAYQKEHIVGSMSPGEVINVEPLTRFTVKRVEE